MERRPWARVCLGPLPLLCCEAGPVGGLKGLAEVLGVEEPPAALAADCEPRGPVGMLPGPPGVVGEGDGPDIWRDDCWAHVGRPLMRRGKLPPLDGGT